MVLAIGPARRTVVLREAVQAAVVPQEVVQAVREAVPVVAPGGSLRS
jgi:hypothetical protein